MSKENVSDEYHTFDELYDHRHALFIALMKSHPKISWRAKHPKEIQSFTGWFIAGMHLPTGDISYHLPNNLWNTLDNLGITTTERGPEWDLHQSSDVVIRLINWVGLIDE
jgi:hypothetical protein